MKQRKENVSRILEDEGKCMADKTKVFSKRDKNVDYMNQMLPVEDSFDIVQRDIQIGGKDATFYFIDGFTKDESMLKIMDSFFNIKDTKSVCNSKNYCLLKVERYLCFRNPG